MQFPTVFRRQKGVGGFAALGTETPPPNASFPNDTKPNSGLDPGGGSPLLATRMKATDGWPPHRLAVVVRYVGVASPPAAVNLSVFMYEESTGGWYQLGATQSVVPAYSADQKGDTSGGAGTTTSNNPAFFDCVVPIDYANVRNSQNPSPGNAEFLIVLADPGAASNGTYIVAATADQTTAMS
jgi:hypothetical protein